MPAIVDVWQLLNVEIVALAAIILLLIRKARLSLLFRFPLDFLDGRQTDLMGDIAAASHEQSTGIEHVNQAIGHMEQVTQQNAALVEQAASAAESLKEEAMILAQAVSVFKLDGERVAAQVPVAGQGPSTSRPAALASVTPLHAARLASGRRSTPRLAGGSVQ